MKSMNVKTLFILVFVSFFGVNSFSQTIADNAIKKNRTSIENATASLSQLEPLKFEYDVDANKQLGLKKGVQYGFLADNVRATFPELVKSKNVSYMHAKNVQKEAKLSAIDEESLIPILVASIKELHIEIGKLKEEVKALKGN